MDVTSARKRNLCLIPVREDKKPLVPWKEFQGRLPTDEEFQRWKGRNPAAYAVVTGEISGCIVLDFDGEAGRNTLSRLRLEPHVQTPSGGAHVYVEHPGVPVTTANHGACRELNRLFPGMDVRGDGGYAIAFGRNHAGEYRWTGPDDFLPFENLPPDVQRLLTEGAVRPLDGSHGVSACEQDQEDLLHEALQEAETAGRNNALFNLACRLRDTGLREEEALPVCLRFAELAPATNAKGTEGPLTESEVRATVQSAFSRPVRENRQRTAGRLSQADRLLEAVTPVLRLMRSPDKLYFAQVPGGRTLVISDTAFEQWLRRFWLEQGPSDKALRSEAVTQVRRTLEAQAADGGERHVYLRSAPDGEGGIFYNLGSGRVVHITREGWSLHRDTPVLFLDPGRPDSTLPDPQQGGSLLDLRRFLHCDDEQFALVCGWLVFSVTPGPKFPLLALSGGEGSGKSTATRILKELVDPGRPELLQAPKEPRDIWIATRSNSVLAYNNVSVLPSELSDTLCIVLDGDGSAQRKLYSDEELRTWQAARPVIINSIPEVVTRSDLMDRAIPLALQRVEHYVAEEELLEEFYRLRPSLLGALFDAVALGLWQRDSVKPDTTARLVSFARFAAAAAPSWNCTPEEFLQYYREARQEGQRSILDGDPVIEGLIQFLEDHEAGEARSGWRGAASDLLEELNHRTPPERRGKRWPANGKSLSQYLRRMTQPLAVAGYTVSCKRLNNQRLLEITRWESDASASGGDASGDASEGAISTCVTSADVASPASVYQGVSPDSDAPGPVTQVTQNYPSLSVGHWSTRGVERGEYIEPVTIENLRHLRHLRHLEVDDYEPPAGWLDSIALTEEPPPEEEDLDCEPALEDDTVQAARALLESGGYPASLPELRIVDCRRYLESNLRDAVDGPPAISGPATDRLRRLVEHLDNQLKTGGFERGGGS